MNTNNEKEKKAKNTEDMEGIDMLNNVIDVYDLKKLFEKNGVQVVFVKTIREIRKTDIVTGDIHEFVKAVSANNKKTVYVMPVYDSKQFISEKTVSDYLDNEVSIDENLKEACGWGFMRTVSEYNNKLFSYPVKIVVTADRLNHVLVFEQNWQNTVLNTLILKGLMLNQIFDDDTDTIEEAEYDEE